MEVVKEKIVEVPESLTESHELLPANPGMSYEDLEEAALHCAAEVRECNMDKAEIRKLKTEENENGDSR